MLTPATAAMGSFAQRLNMLRHQLTQKHEAPAAYSRLLNTAGQQAIVMFATSKRHPKNAGGRPGVSPGAPTLQQHSARSTLLMPSSSSRMNTRLSLCWPGQESNSSGIGPA